VLTRVAGAAVPLDRQWLDALAFLGGFTALVAALGALRANTSLGWLGYAATAQVGFAVVGFLVESGTGRAAGWLGLGSGAIAVTLAGLGLGLGMRGARRETIVGPGDLPASWFARLPLGIGYLALAGVPPFPTFTARRLLLASLLEGRSSVDLLLAALVVAASLLLAAAVWQALLGSRQAPVELDGHTNGSYVTRALEEPALALPLSRLGGYPERESTASPRALAARAEARPILWPARGLARWRARRLDRARVEWEMLGSLSGLALLVVLAGLIPLAWLGSALQLAPPAPSGAPSLAASVLLALAIGGAVWLNHGSSRLKTRLRLQKRLTRRLVWLNERYHLDVATDPYLIVGGLLLGLGRASAAILNNTLGRLARAD